MDNPIGVTLVSALLYFAGLTWAFSIISGFFSIALTGMSFTSISILIVALLLGIGDFVAGYWVSKLKKNGLMLALTINVIAIIANFFSNRLLYAALPIITSIYLLVKRDLFTQ